MTLSQKQTAFVFPGQGSQTVGMGKALAAAFPVAAETFAEADAILGFPLSALCWEGPGTDLGETLNTQPALLTHSVAAWRALMLELDDFAPLCAAGHSLGEYSALVAAGALEFADAVRLTRERGRVMTEAGKNRPGGMAAVLNLDTAVLTEICAQASREAGGPVVLANDNSPGQVVISGEIPALERASALAQERGATRVLRLNVSIASHSPLMEEAAVQFAAAVDSTPIADPRVPVIGNTTARALTTAEEIKAEIKAQLTNSVRWVDSVRAMTAMGASVFVELGTKDVLTGLLRRIDAQTMGVAAGDPDSVRAVLGV
jgi:[acyl-carrier-protein] S-malonyltransferase